MLNYLVMWLWPRFSVIFFVFSFQAVCSDVVVEPRKAIRKLPRVQHLHALLAGRLKSEEDEVRAQHSSFLLQYFSSLTNNYFVFLLFLYLFE